MTIALLLFAASSGFSVQPSSMVSISQQLFDSMEKAGQNPRRQLLAGDNPALFPFSVQLDFERSGLDSTSIHRLIIAIPQDMAITCLSELVALAGEMETASPGVSMTMVLLANENAPLPMNKALHPSGSQVFLNSIPDPEASALVMLASSSSRSQSILVIPGNGGIITPLWLLKQIELPIPQNAILAYRLNVTQDNQSLSPFFRAGMAAVGIQFSPELDAHKQQVFQALTSLVHNFSTEEAETASSVNYLPLSSGVWLGEQVLVLIFLAISMVVLAMISGLSFIGSNSSQRHREFLGNWYLIIITILISSLSLILGQLVGDRIIPATPRNAISILTIKTVFSFLLVSLPFMLHLHFTLPLSNFIYGYLLTLVAAANIFIFTAIDVTLLFVFMVEYLVVYLSQFVRRLVFLLVASLLMIVPYIPYLLNLLEYGSMDKLLALVHTGILGNILYACILTPFQIMWLRILVRMNIFGMNRHIQTSKMVAASLGLLVAMGMTIATSILLGSYMLYRSLPPLLNNADHDTRHGLYQVSGEDEQLPVTVTLSQEQYLSLRAVRLDIQSQLPIIRYEVTVKSNTTIPILDSSLQFLTYQDESHTISQFIIPDFPARDTFITFVTDVDIQREVDVTVYVETGKQEATAFRSTTSLP